MFETLPAKGFRWSLIYRFMTNEEME